MIKITFPDGNIREYEAGISPMQIAESISMGLAKKVLVAEVDGKSWDLTRTLAGDCALKLYTWDDTAGKEAYWHSSAHLMAEALEALYPNVKLGIGPPIEQGFYYDIDLGEGRTMVSEDLAAIEKKMVELASKNSAFERSEVNKQEAIRFFTEKADPYKLELLQDLTDGEITFYKQGNFTDLCRGPHIPNTSYIKSVKLLNIAGAYWRGNEKNPMMTRLYGITFPKQAELDAYLTMLEEAKRRDHRKIGKELSLFTFDDMVGQGLPLWLPNGGIMIEEMERLAKEDEDADGYHRVVTPHIAKEELYITSGHLPYYAESMYPPMEMDGTKYYLRAMNCPHHHKVFDAEQKSYKDLPYRLAEYGTCYRYEDSGALFGIMRSRVLHMNDAHIYCTKDQFYDEFSKVNRLYQKNFELFGVTDYKMRLSLHDPSKLGQKYVNNSKLWLETEAMVRNVLYELGVPFEEVADEAAFYGPKIDVEMKSAIGRWFTMATNQVDFSSAEKFNLTFKNSNNEEERPLIIHRAPLGTHERYIGFLIEHFAGNFPTWLAPQQVIILPISDKFMPYAHEVNAAMRAAGIRSKTDDRNEKIGKKIRDAEVLKVPYMMVIGEKEMNENKVSVRIHGQGDKGMLPVEEVVSKLKQEIRTRSLVHII
ncbi:MAG: threonine--tRNA ligase [Chitinophagales bacterium]|jgi:threonyl-tRNA synthetase|nr:threonine--tRNA ligase [Sphingobacteriales bacterium]